MFDCADVEIRELLPDLAAGSLDDSTRARVEHHVASCAECASELETLRLVRSAYAATPSVDVQWIVVLRGEREDGKCADTDQEGVEPDRPAGRY